MTTAADRIADTYDAARAYVDARRELDGADTRTMMSLTSRVDEAWHELQFYATGECTICDPGTCPLGPAAA